MITKLQAETHRGEFWHMTLKNADGTPIRCRVNGKCKTWKRTPNLFKLPVKHGMRDSFYITNFEGDEVKGVQQNTNNHRWCLPELWAVESELFRGAEPEDKDALLDRARRMAQGYGMGTARLLTAEVAK